MILGLIIFVLAIIILVFLAFKMRKASGMVIQSELEDFLEAQGAARCERAVALLRNVPRLRPEESIHQIWEQIELPLLEALPDCPPGLKTILIHRLDALHGTCKNREYQKCFNAMRNSLA